MKLFKSIRGRYHYNRYLKYKGWYMTGSIESLYKSFYLGYQPAENVRRGKLIIRGLGQKVQKA